MHPSVVRQIHASRIFHAIRLNPDASQREIAEKADTDKSTVSAILREFESAGLIQRATKAAGNGRGRPGESITISSSGGILVGIHPSPSEIKYVATGIDGQAIASQTRPLPHRNDLADDVNRDMEELVAQAGRRMADVRAVGVSVPGLVRLDGHLAHSPNLGWRDFELRKALKSTIEAPLYIDNNCNADAVAEYMFGVAVNDETFIYVDSSSGVGCGLFLNGTLYRGVGGFAGEFGHAKIIPNGRLCRCGNCGCLSAYISDFAIMQRLQQDGLQASSVHDIEEMAAAGDQPVRQILTEVGRHLGLGVSNLVNTFNPSLVILGGSLARLAPFIRSSMLQTLEELALPAILDECTVEFSKLSLAVVPQGGIALALEGCTSYSGKEPPLWLPPAGRFHAAAELTSPDL